MVVIKNFIYVPSQSIVVQGNKRVIDSYKKKGYYIAKGGNGSYRMYKPSVTDLVFEVDNDGKEHVQCVKKLIYDYYKVERVTRKKIAEFLDDCESKKIKLKYSKKKGLYF